MKDKKTLSIIVPVYNEEKTIRIVLDKLRKLNIGLDKEIIVVNDGSTDSSETEIKRYIDGVKDKKIKMRLISKKNEGKGSALVLGIREASGEIITIQDADLEYNPEDYKKLIMPVIEGKEKVVYGSRFMRKHEPLYRIYFIGNKLLTFLTKIIYGAKITDMETCYKVFDSDVIKNIEIKARKFDFEPEVTAKILKKKIRIREIPISYSPRKIEEGKKIGWKDGVQAIYTLVYWKIH